MAVETVDTRVVEARFDSKQFEKGVDKTVKKLDELKKSLNLKDTGKSVADLGDKISESTSKASDSLEKLQNRFTSFAGMLKQKFLGGIADEIVGVFFKLKNSFESLVSSMSTAQISRGMQRYTDILTSVRTLTAAGVSENAAYESIERLGMYADQTSYSLDELVSTMSKFKTAGASLDTARRMVEGLSNAAASMGVNAQQAARAYLNLQQAYSKGKMTQADWISFESLPMVGEKFNQAILDAAEKVGTLKKNAKGTYEVVSKAVKADGGVGGRVSGAAAKGITAENMGTKLASGWFNKKVMEEVFGNTYYFEDIGIAEVNKIKKKEEQIKADLRKEIEKGIVAEKDFDKEVTKRLQDYFDETNKASLEEKKKEIAERKKTKQLEYDAAVKDLKGDERKKAMEEYRKSIAELDKELTDFENAHHLSAFAYQAFRAGQEARSFTDVLNTLKDAISRGWATSFELIFGKLDEASAFFTKLTESQFAEGIYAIGEFRNAVLESWRNNGGREDMLSVLEYMDDLAGNIFKKLGLITDEEDYFNKHFDEHKYMALNQRDPEAAEQYKQSIQDEAADHSPFEDMAKELGQRLSIVGRNIKDFFEGVKKWFTEADTTGVSRLQRITNIINNFSNVFTGAATAVGMGLEFIGNIYLSLKTTFDHLWQALDRLTQKFFSLFNPKASQEGLTVFRAIEDTFNNILKVVQPLDEPLGKIIDILTDIISFAIDIGAGTVVGNIQFFADAFGLLLELLGIGSSQQDRKAGVLDGITKEIENFGEVCKSAIKSIGEFFDSIFKDLRIFLGLDKENKLKEGGIFANIQDFFKTNEFVETVKGWIDNAIKNIGEFIRSIPSRLGKIFSGIKEGILDLFYEGFYIDSKGEKTWIKKPLLQWLETAYNTVANFITIDIPNFIKSLPSLIGKFLEGIFYTTDGATSYYKDGKLQPLYNKVPNALKQWLDQAIKDVTEFISSIPGEIAKIPSIIGEFFSGLFYEKKTAKKNVKGFYEYQDTRTPLKRWLDQAVLDVRNFIKSIPGKLKKIPNIISEFFKNLLYTGFYKDSKGNKTWVKKPFVQWVDDNLIKPLSEFVKNLPTYIGQGIGNVFNFVKTVVGAIFGKENGEPVTSTDIENELQEPFSGINLNGVLETIKDIGKNILNGIISAFTGNLDWENNKDWIQTKVANAIDGIRKKAEEVWPKVRDWFVSLPESIANFFKGEDGTKNESTPIGSAISAFIKSVGEWLSSIPDTLLTVWENIEKQSGTIWDSIIGWITGNPKDTSKLKSEYQSYYDDLIRGGAFSDAEDYKKFALYQQWRDDNPIAANIEDFFKHLVDYFGEKITAIPGQIEDAWNSLVTVATIVWDVITGQYDPDDPKDYGNPIFNKIEEFVGEFAIQIATKFKELPSKLKGAWDTAVDIGKMIKNVIFGNTGKPLFDQVTYNNILFGKNFASENWSQETRERMAELYKNSTTDYTNGNSNNPLYKSIESFFDGIVKWVVSEANALPNKIRIAWGSVVDISKTIGEVIFGTGKPVFDKNMYNKMLGADGHGTAAAEAYKNSVKDFGNPIINSISLFFEKIRDWVRESINKLPSLIAESWTVTKTIGLVIWDIITGQYESKKENQDDTLYNSIGTFIESFAKKVGIKLKEIPDKIKSAIGTIGDIATIIKNVIFHNTGKPLFDEATYNSILFGTNNASEKWSQEIRERMAELYKNSTTDYTEGESNNPLYKAIESFFNGIVNWIRDQITSLPDKIRNLWSTAKDIGSIIRDTLFGSAHVIDEKEIERLMAIDPSGYAAKMYKDTAMEYNNPLYTSLANFFVRVRDWIRGFITDLPDNIAKGWNAAKEFMKEIGPIILSGLQSALDWVGDRFNDITNFMNDAHNDNISVFTAIKEKLKYTDDTGKEIENPIWTAIQKIGESIKRIIVEVIPSFITSAIDEIKISFPSLISNLFNIGGNDKNDAEKILIDSVIPKFDQNYYDSLINAGAFGDAEEYKKKFEERKDELIKTNSNLVVDYYEAMADQYGVSVDEIKSIMSDSNGSISGFGFIVGAFADSISEEDIKKAEELKENDKKIQELTAELIKNKEIAIAYAGDKDHKREYDDAVAEQRRLQKLIDELQITEEKSSDIQKQDTKLDNKVDKSSKSGLPGVDTIVNGFGNLFSTIGNVFGSETGKTVALLVAASVVLYALRDMLSLSDEIEALGTTALKIAFGGIVAIVGYMVYLATQTDQTKFNRVKEMFTHIEKFLENLAGVLILLKAMDLGSDIAETITEFKKAGNGATGGVGIIGKAFDVLSGPLNILFGSSAVGVGIESITGKLTDSAIKIGQSFDVLVDVMAPSIDNLAGLNTNIDSAIEVLGKVGTLIASFTGMVSEEQDNVFWEQVNDSLIRWGEETSEETGTNRHTLLHNLDNKMSLIYMMSVVFRELGNALNAISNAGSIEEIKEKLKTMSEVIISDEFYNVYLNLLKGIYRLCQIEDDVSIQTGSRLADISQIGIVTRFMADSLSVFSDSITGIDDESITAMNHFFELLDKLAEIIGTNKFTGTQGSEWKQFFFGDTSLGAFGKTLNTFAVYMVPVFRSIKNVKDVLFGEDIMDVESSDFKNRYGMIEQTITEIVSFSRQLLSLANWMSFTAFDRSKIESVGSVLPKLGTQINEFLQNVKITESGDIINLEYATTIGTFLETLKDSILGALTYFESAPEKFDYLADALIGKDGKSGFIGRINSIGSVITKDSDIYDTVDILWKLSEVINSFSGSDSSGKFIYQTALENIMSLASNGDFDIVAPIISALDKLKEYPWSDILTDDFYSFAKNFSMNLGIADPATGRDTQPIFAIIDAFDCLKEYSWSSILSDDFYTFAEQFRNALGILSFDDNNSMTALSESLNELASFKWEDVNTDFTAPMITPVLNLEDQNFKDQIAKMHQMLGFTMDETGMLVNPELTFNNNLDLPKLDDISNKLDYLNTIALYISQLKETADQFNTSLSNMQFIINGEEFTKVIGPTMDRWLGTEGFYAARLIT